MSRLLILDTTVLIYDPNVIFAFDESDIYIPLTVLEDIDKFKKDMSENGRNARYVARILDDLRKGGSLINGVKIKNGSTVYVTTASTRFVQKIPRDFYDKKRDTYFLANALEIKEKTGSDLVVLTKDLNLRVKANALEIRAEGYESEKLDIDELYKGYTRWKTGPAEVQELKKSRSLKIGANGLFQPNQYVILEDGSNVNNIAYGRYSAFDKTIHPLIQQVEQINMRIDSKNQEQAFAIDALLNDNIDLVTLVGKAGTGKTLLAVAASIYLTVDKNLYNKILVSRPTLPMGKDIGFLPGDVEAKLTPWMYPIMDNIEYIMEANNTGRRSSIRGFDELVEMGILTIEPLTFIRGRSIHNQYLIIDEAQNLTPHEIKTVITRVGIGTKIVLTGDPYQIDNPYIDSTSNGLTNVVEKFKKSDITAHISLSHGERSPLSDLAATLM